MKSDAQLLSDVEAELLWTPDVESAEISVAVKGGVVTLGGFVPDFHAGHIPVPSEYAEGDWYPLALDDVVLRAIQVRPEARFQTAEEFLAALRALRRPSVPGRAAIGVLA